MDDKEMELRTELDLAARKLAGLPGYRFAFADEPVDAAASAQAAVENYRPGRRSAPQPPQHIWIFRYWTQSSVTGVFASPKAYLSWIDRIGGNEIDKEVRTLMENYTPEDSSFVFTERTKGAELSSGHVVTLTRIEVIDG